MQSEFVLMVADLITWVYSHPGWELTWGEAKRTNEQAEINAMGFEGRSKLVQFIKDAFPILAGKIADNTGDGIRNSLHEQGLAVDLNFFIEGELQRTVAAYAPLGRHWESKGGSWGGNWGDADHFSLSPDGGKTR